MQKSKRLNLVELMKEKEILVHNDRAKLFRYIELTGVWKEIGDLEARAIIREFGIQSGEVEIDYADCEYIRRELSESVELQVDALNSFEYSEWIVVQNGRLNLKTGELSPHDKKKYDTIALNFKYVSGASINYHSNTANFLKTSLGVDNFNPRESKALAIFYQCLGYSLSNLPNLKKMPILLGVPNSGKSVILKLCAKIMESKKIRALSLQDCTNKFRLGLLEGANLVICHEVRLGQLKRLDIVKSIISGDPITIEAKGVQPWTYFPKVKLLMAANALPTLGEIDVGGAFVERLIIVPFIEHSGENDIELLDKLYSERDMLFSVIFDEMNYFINHGMKFEEEEFGKVLLSEYKINGNSLNGFLNERYEKGSNDDYVSTVALYEEYKNYCKENVLPACSDKQFISQILQLGYKVAKKRQKQGIRKIGNPLSSVLNLKPRTISLKN